MIRTLVAREQITIDNTAGGKTLTAATLATKSTSGRFRVEYADIDVQTADIRTTIDGSTAPVGATTGALWYAQEKYRVWGIANLSNLKMIRDGGTSAVVVVEYWGYPATAS